MTRAGLRAAARQVLRTGLKALEPGHLVRTQLRVLGPDRVFTAVTGTNVADVTVLLG